MLIASLVLLVAMIGAMLLAKQPNSPFLYDSHGKSLRSKQDLFLQISRERLYVPSGQVLMHVSA